VGGAPIYTCHRKCQDHVVPPQYLSVIAAAGIGGLISVGGSYLMSKPVNDTLARHEKIHEHHGKLLEHHGILLQETNEKLNEVRRMLRKKTQCFIR
jgi:hypothetical protein